MIQNYITYRILQSFFDYPTRYFQLREISRMLKIGLPSVISHIKKLEKEGFLLKEKKRIYASYKANKKAERFKIYKKNDIILRCYESGLIEHISTNTSPNAIVLYGSAARGEDTETSDIDLFVLAKEIKIKTETFEKKLNRKIRIFFEQDIKDLPKELLNNIINGIVLYGYLKIK